MFLDWSMSEARQVCKQMLDDRVVHLDDEGRKLALKLVSRELEIWKSAQADATGYVEVTLPALVGGGGRKRSIKLKDLATPWPKRIAVTDLEAWQVGNSGDCCDSDVWARLHSQGDERIVAAEQALGMGVAVTVLAQRDIEWMPPHSLAWVLRVIWILTYERMKGWKEFASQTHEYLTAAEKKQRDQRVEASAAGAAANANAAAVRHAEWLRIGVDHLKEHLRHPYKTVAKAVCDELARRGVTPVRSVETVEDYLVKAKARDLAVEELRNAGKRAGTR